MKLLRILLVVLGFTAAITAGAYDFEAGGLYFDFVSTGDLTCALVKGPSDYTGALVIPDEVEYSGKKLKVVSVECFLTQVSSVKFGRNITTISHYCFHNNQLVTSITIPNSIETIGNYAFEGCTSLTSVKWEGEMVLSIAIFRNCTKLKTLSYKSTCKEIPAYAFKNCSSLLSIDLSKVEIINESTFTDCSSLNVIDLSSIKKMSGYSIFKNCMNISSLTLGPDINSVDARNFEGCSIDSLTILPSENKLKIDNKFSLKSLYLGRNIDSYYYAPPFGESDISFVKVGKIVTDLGINFFKGCKNLNQIIFEGTDIKIDSYCFQGTSLKTINLPSGINAIGASVFPSGIESISFGSNVRFTDSFSNIRNESTLKEISILSNTPPLFFYGSFGNQIYAYTKLLVPYGSKEAYQKADVWKNFWNIEEMPGVDAEKVEIKPTNTNLLIGDTIRLTGTRYPENTIDTIQWKSSDAKIATISSDGLVKAISPGKATITAICGKVSAICEVTVLPINAEKISLDISDASLIKADSIKITATVAPENTTDKTIKWSSSDEKVATVSRDGKVTAVGAGTATITAVCGEVSATCEVTVYEPNISVEYNDNTLTVAVEGSADPIKISVFSVFGQCIFRQSVDASITVKEEIDLSKLPTGTYIIQVTSGTMSTSKRIVK